jgi:peroxiredoxin
MVQVVFGMVLPWLLLAAGCWLVLQLIHQNGRILLRLEGLEKQLEELANRAPVAGPMQEQEPAGLPQGSPAPEFRLQDLSGKPHSLAGYRGKRVLLMFFSPKCGFCTQMLDELAALPANGSTQTPMPIVVTSGTADENRAMFPPGKFKFPVLLQKQGEVSAAYQAYGTPIGYLIDEQGNLASPMTAGAEGLIALARSAPQAGTGLGTAEKNGHAKTGRGNRPLSSSKLTRDGLRAGTPAPLFRLPRVDGGQLALEEYRGKKGLLVFSDPHCGPCTALDSELERIHREHPEISVLMVSRRDLESNRKKIRESGLTFPVVLQKNWDTSMLYGMFATPIAFLIDEGGMIAADVAVGADAILALVPGFVPAHAQPVAV